MANEITFDKLPQAVIDEIEYYLHISKANLYSCVAKREVRTRFHSGIMQFSQKDVLRIIKDNQINYHNEL